MRANKRSLIPCLKTELVKMLLSDIKDVQGENKAITEPLIIKIMDRNTEWLGTIQPMLRLVIADKSDAQQCISYNREDDARMQVGNVFIISNFFVFRKLIQIRKTTKLYK